MDTKNIDDFLQASKSEGAFTHTSLNGGKYFIKEEDMSKFYDLYYESVFLDQNKHYLVEKNTHIGALRVDFDFIYESDIKTHQHTQEQVLSFVKAYMTQLKEYIQIPPSLEIFIMEKKLPT